MVNAIFNESIEAATASPHKSSTPGEKRVYDPTREKYS
jgi:hypothetical protein